MKTVSVSGYFDPLHVGRLEYFNIAKELGDKLIVLVNNDQQAIIKKGYVFMPCEDRKKIVSALSIVDEVVKVIDQDRSVSKTLAKVKPDIFANGGGWFTGEVPELKVCREHGIEIVDGFGDKIRSSSELVKKPLESQKKMRK